VANSDRVGIVGDVGFVDPVDLLFRRAETALFGLGPRNEPIGIRRGLSEHGLYTRKHGDKRDRG
jgi:hypothetical protein